MVENEEECPRGHLYSGNNIKYSKNMTRHCRTCECAREFIKKYPEFKEVSSELHSVYYNNVKYLLGVSYD